MTCRATRRRLAEYHDRELSIEDQIAVQAHIDGCADCWREAHDIAKIGEGLRTMAATSGQGWHRELAGLPSGVVSRLSAERQASFGSRLGRMFEDMHFVWAAGGATMATLACGVIIHGLLLTAARERPDSLAGVLSALATSGENENPAPIAARMLLPRADADMVMPAAVVSHGHDEDAVLAFSAVLTREGTVSNIELLGSDDQRRDLALQRDSRELLEILDAASTARFEPARYEGVPVAVNMVWLVARTTVRAKTPAVSETWHVPAAPAVSRPPDPSVKPPSSDSDSSFDQRSSIRRRHSMTTTLA
jgi:hypothetical protein